MEKIIYVKQIEDNKWHGKKGKENFSQPTFVCVPPNPDTMMYNIELDNEKKVFKDPTNSEKKLTELEYYSKVLKKDLTPIFTPDTPHPFYDSNLGLVKLTRETKILNLNNPLHYIQYKILLGSGVVANSLEEYKEGVFPEARYVIIDSSIEKERKSSSFKLKKEALRILDKMSKKRILEMIYDFSGNDLSNAPEEDLNTYLNDLLESSPQIIIDSKRDENLSLKVIVKKALQKNILKRKNGKILYYDSEIGNSINSVVDFLNDEKNNEIRIKIIAQTE